MQQTEFEANELWLAVKCSLDQWMFFNIFWLGGFKIFSSQENFWRLKKSNSGISLSVMKMGCFKIRPLFFTFFFLFNMMSFTNSPKLSNWKTFRRFQSFWLFLNECLLKASKKKLITMKSYRIFEQSLKLLQVNQNSLSQISFHHLQIVPSLWTFFY